MLPLPTWSQWSLSAIIIELTNAHWGLISDAATSTGHRAAPKARNSTGLPVIAFYLQEGTHVQWQ